MNQQDIETFLTLTKTGSLTRTAEILYVSQPTVSHRLKELEQELGIPLLMRGKGQRRIELTRKGEEFIAIAERWLSLMAETTLLRNETDEICLSIGCPNTLNNTLLLPFYQSILADPGLKMRLNISTHYSYNIYELMERHAIDIGFVYHLLNFKNIIVEPVLQESMVLVQEASRAIPKDRIYLEELDPQNEICFIWESNFQVWHDQMISRGQKNYIEVDIYSLLAAFLQTPGRWTIAPLSVARMLEKTQDVRLSAIADPRTPPERITYLIKNRHTNEAKETGIEVLRTRILEYLRNSEYLAPLKMGQRDV